MEDEEAMELVPHITLNPSFNIDMLEYIEPEVSSPTSDLQYCDLTSGGASAMAGTTTTLRKAASKAAAVTGCSSPGAGSSSRAHMRKSSDIAEDKVSLVENTP